MNSKGKLELIRKLQSETIAGNLEWEKTSDEKSFQVTVASYVISVTEIQDSRDGDYCEVTILDAFGSVVERIQRSDFHDIALPDDMHPAKFLSDFYAAARSSAMGADKAMVEIMQALDKLRKPNPPTERPVSGEDVPF